MLLLNPPSLSPEVQAESKNSFPLPTQFSNDHSGLRRLILSRGAPGLGSRVSGLHSGARGLQSPQSLNAQAGLSTCKFVGPNLKILRWPSGLL